MAKLIDELSKRINKKQSKYKTFSVKLKEEDIELLDKVSKATGMSKSELVEMSLRKEGLLDKKSVDKLLKSLEEVDEMEEIAGNRLVWRHIQRENQLMILNPLGYNPIKDIDEITNRNRRKSDDPYIRATMENADHKRWKNNPAERR